ncbi:MAG: DUF3810 domain-containing protein [Suilimivivens sp.]
MIKIRTNKKKKWKIVIPSLLTAVALLLNMAGWMSSSFCNFYVKHIFPIWVETYGRLTGIFPFSVGEKMLYLAVILVAVLIVWTLIYSLFHRFLPKRSGKLLKGYGTVIFWIFGIVCVIMTLNCFLLYHVSPVNERYVIGGNSRQEYGVAEITALRDYVVEQANMLSSEMKRDADGELLYEGDMKQEAKKQMQRLAGTFPELQGYYPDPKPLSTSDFFSQQYIMGYYFPFSMEANYNDIMCVINLPVTICHELSHLKGFIREDEANFIGYLACVDSEDAFFRYSAYLSVINYIDNDFYKAIAKNDEIYASHPVINGQVLLDKKFLSQETWEQVEETALIDTEIVKQASNTFTETTLVLNGVEDGKISYSRVVDLLLQYYDGILY